MMRPLKHLFSRLKHDESGSPTVEFVLVIPIYISLLLISVELGMITLRHALLERGLDIAVRTVRLSTINVPEYAQIKTLVCANALFLDNCNATLRLEMKRTDIRNYVPMGPILCEDSASPTTPGNIDLTFDNSGLPNQLMQIRACYRFDPFIPSGLLGQALSKDTNGQAAIVSTSAFVQEPL
jgi:Flp pilus assembly pilin Flp